jgi:hypothetical protein
MTADQRRLKSMLVGMAVIIGFSGTMHVYLVRKKAIRTHRYEPQYGDSKPLPKQGLAEGKGTVEGEVVAVSFDKFFLRTNGRVQPFATGSLKMPSVGEVVAVSYEGGSPPTALDITRRSP